MNFLLDMAIFELERQMSWVVKGCARFESDWIAMHRFLWMNAISCDALWCVLKGQKTKSSPRNHKRSFPDNFLQKLQDKKLTREFGAHFKARSLDNCFGSFNGRMMSKAEDIRYCPACLRECFHSPLFQLANVTKCPLHGNKLISKCQHCGHNIGKPTFNIEIFNFPLMCMHCKQPFCGVNCADKVFNGFTDGEPTFSFLEEWLKQLSLVQFIRTDELGGQPGSPRNYKTICDSLVGLAIDNSIVNPPTWLDMDFPFIKYRLRNESHFMGIADFALHNRAVPLEHDFDLACRIAKSLNHYLSRKIRAICGHRKTSNLTWEFANRPFQRAQPMLKIAQGDCPCCAVLDQWRAYTGKLIALRDLARSFGRPVYEWEFGDFRILYSLEPRECAEALISSFSWFACALSRVLLQLSGHQPHSEHLEQYQFLDFTAHITALPLDVYRFDICSQGYVLINQSEEITLAYSLEHAFESLRTCMALYRNRVGLFWSIDEVNAHKHIRGIRGDDWYVKMSTYIHTRRDAHSWSFTPNPDNSNIYWNR
jgi:hypothetical protein